VLLGKEPKLTLKQRYGDWAAITGATDGIGKAYARELAKQGLNVLLISRTESKLRDVCGDIERDFGVETKWIVADFFQGKEVYRHIEKELKDLQIGILVNNVGILTPRFDILSSFEEDDVWKLIHANIVAVTILSHFFLRRMQQNNIKGAIVNISSGTEGQPCPYVQIYAASKSYNRSLTIALQEEARPLGITVQLVSPWLVATPFNSYSKYIMRGGLFIPTAEELASWAVSTIGKTDRTSGYFWHGVQAAVFNLAPPDLRTAIGTRWFTRVIMNINPKLKKNQ